MREVGIDISGHRSKSVDQFLGTSFDYVITVCDNARGSCPVFPGKSRRIHWSFEDPAAAQGTEDEKMEAFRRIRDQIAEKLKAFASGPRTRQAAEEEAGTVWGDL
jgi:arsenate reductase